MGALSGGLGIAAKLPASLIPGRQKAGPSTAREGALHDHASVGMTMYWGSIGDARGYVLGGGGSHGG